jgi:benzoate-CoA ligase
MPKRTAGIREDDTVFSAAKLFFAYGLGNALTFPLSVGASTILMSERVKPESVFARLRQHHPTIFCGTPALFAGMLDSAAIPRREELNLRLCLSAGEALPRDLGERFSRTFGCDILDGLGSSEMLHIFISNRPYDLRYGSSGKPVEGYSVELRGEAGAVPDGEIGDLWVSGPSAALFYWNAARKRRAPSMVRGSRPAINIRERMATTPTPAATTICSRSAANSSRRSRLSRSYSSTPRYSRRPSSRSPMRAD